MLTIDLNKDYTPDGYKSMVESAAKKLGVEVKTLAQVLVASILATRPGMDQVLTVIDKQAKPRQIKVITPDEETEKA